MHIDSKKLYFYISLNKIQTMPDLKNILIIDDSNTNVVLLEAVLGTKKFRSQTALSVKEALPLIKNDKPDLILLDLLMPDVSGFDFLEQVKKNSDLNDIPIVVVSALTDEENIQKTLDLGAKRFIKKPIDISSLVQTVEEILK